MAVTKEVQFILEAANDLPPLPETLTKVLRRMEDKNVSLKEIGALISHDASLTARILKTANSAFYNPLDEIKSIETATSRLGIDTVRNILVTLSLLDTFPQIYNEYYTHIFQSSIFTALASESIADYCMKNVKSDAFFTGLLLNVGKLLFLRYLEEKYIRILNEAKKYYLDIRTVEKIYLGIDHLEAGSIIAKRWKLPAFVSGTLAYFDKTKNNELDKEQDLIPLIQVVCSAYRANEFYLGWNKYLHYGMYTDNLQNFFSVPQNESTPVLKTMPGQLKNLSASIGLTIPETDNFDTTMKSALNELENVEQVNQKIYSNYLHSFFQLKEHKKE